MPSTLKAPLWCLAIAWLAQSLPLSIRWLVSAGPGVWSILVSKEFRWIAITHIVLGACSVAAPVVLWRRYEATALAVMTLASIAWLFGDVFHFYLLLERGWLLWAVPRVALSLLTLVVVLVYAARKARAAPQAST